MYRWKRRQQKKKKEQRDVHTESEKEDRRPFEQIWFRVQNDVVNQAAKVAPGVIKAVTSDTNNIAQDRINQIISQGGKEVEHVLPKILRGAIEDVYQTPFRVLRNFGKQQFN